MVGVGGNGEILLSTTPSYLVDPRLYSVPYPYMYQTQEQPTPDIQTLRKQLEEMGLQAQPQPAPQPAPQTAPPMMPAHVPYTPTPPLAPLTQVGSDLFSTAIEPMLNTDNSESFLSSILGGILGLGTAAGLGRQVINAMNNAWAFPEAQAPTPTQASAGQTPTRVLPKPGGTPGPLAQNAMHVFGNETMRTLGEAVNQGPEAFQNAWNQIANQRSGLNTIARTPGFLPQSITMRMLEQAADRPELYQAIWDQIINQRPGLAELGKIGDPFVRNEIMRKLEQAAKEGPEVFQATWDRILNPPSSAPKAPTATAPKTKRPTPRAQARVPGALSGVLGLLSLPSIILAGRQLEEQLGREPTLQEMLSVIAGIDPTQEPML